MPIQSGRDAIGTAPAAHRPGSRAGELAHRAEMREAVALHRRAFTLFVRVDGKSERRLVAGRAGVPRGRRSEEEEGKQRRERCANYLLPVNKRILSMAQMVLRLLSLR